MGSREPNHRLACARETLAERSRSNAKDAGGLWSIELENVPEHVSEAMRTIETGQQRLHAANSNFLEQ